MIAFAMGVVAGALATLALGILWLTWYVTRHGDDL